MALPWADMLMARWAESPDEWPELPLIRFEHRTSRCKKEKGSATQVRFFNVH